MFFQAEDPFRFLQRFVHAVKARATQKVKLVRVFFSILIVFIILYINL